MAEENLSPISAPNPPAANPLGPATAAHASTLKLKPVIRKPTIGGAKPGARPLIRPPAAAKPAAPATAPSAPPAMEQLKSVTQKLKGVTQQIPQQAILHKTGIIADQAMTDEQKQASKSRTARISLSDALGVAPVQNEAAPMKTIRIKRPSDIKSPTAPAAPSAPAPAPAAPSAPAAKEEPTLTQRKTLKISRPGGGVRPAGKFGAKKPGVPAPAAAPAAADAEVPDIPDIDDDKTLATVPAAVPAVAAPPSNRIPDVPKGLAIFDLILQIAACVAIGFLAYLLYVDFERDWMNEDAPDPAAETT